MSGEGDRRFVVRRTVWRSLVPRFDEHISPEFYRLSGKLRVWAVAFLIVANVLSGLQLERLQIDEYVYWRLVAFHSVVHLADLVLGLLIWRGNLRVATMRVLTYVCMVMECSTTLVVLWAFGSVSSHMIIFGVVLVLIYRLGFDFRIGLAAFLTILVGHWGIVIAEVSGWIPSQPIGIGAIDGVYQVAERQITSMIILSILLALTFAVANWSVARMRHKELAIRLLRESLYAAEAGRVGRHTGRTLCDRYVVGTLIGTGGMGEVYTGQHRKTRRKVAIKMLHPHLVEDESVLRRFRREAEVTGHLGSEHIVQILDIDEDDGQPFMVLELMEGESLLARVAERGPLPFDELSELVTQLARGLDAAHEAGVVHRDLKPGNVFLCRRDDGAPLIKILDFGVSKLHSDATAITQEVAILGTPDYMSPEQAVGQVEDIDASSDRFALGAVVYFAITGRPPFEAASVPALLRKICEEEPVPAAELRPGLPGGVADVLAIALAKRKKDRYASAADLAADLAAAVRGESDRIAARAAKVSRGRPPTRTGLEAGGLSTGDTMLDDQATR